MSDASSLNDLINDKAQFDRLMEEIDNQLIQEHVPIPARPLIAIFSIIPSRFNCSFSIASPIGIAINTWFNERYGDKLKIDFTIGETVVLIKGDPYLVRLLPIVNGVISEINVLDWIDAPPGLMNSLGQKDLDNLIELIIEQSEMFTTIYNLPRELTIDLYIAVSCLLRYPIVESLESTILEYGLSKWSSLQAAEKTIKEFIRLKGETPPHTHILNKLLYQAERLNLPKLDSSIVNNVQCSPSVRYDEPVELSDAVKAYHSAVKICHHVALHYK